MGKKKRGRPRKYPIVEVKEKKKRGRPRKNSIVDIETIEDIKIDSIEKRKPGRPKKARAEIILPEVPMLNPPRSGKLAGYCTSCYNALATFDGEFSLGIGPDVKDVIIYTCWKCGYKQTEVDLLKEVPIRKSGAKYRNKREYLEDCLSVNDDSVSFHAPDLISKKDLGVVVDPIEPDDTDEIFG